MSLRAEHFADPDGVRYVGAFVGKGKYDEFTLTGDIALDGGNLHLKPEFRIDIAENKVFIKDAGTANPSSTRIQPTLGMAAVYGF